MDSRGKQRLTGAVILVALFVMLVPELLKGPDKSGSTPADEAGLKTHVIDVESPNPVVNEPAAPAPPVNLAQPKPQPQTELAVPGEAAAPATDEVDPAPAAQAQAQPPAQAQPQTQPRPAPATAKPPATTPAVAPSAPAKPSTSGSGRFAVQLGSFSVRENAERLVREMNAKGFATFITPTSSSGRQLYQVRVGPTRDRASAEALATQLKRVGQSGSVVSIP
jgi:DedD protein